MKRDRVALLYSALREANPEPRSELEFRTPFELLVAVILSAQATDKSVNAATRKLFPVARTPDAVAKLGVDGLAKYIRTIGLWRNKAKNVIATASAIADEHNGVVPRTREELEKLPGVGRKVVFIANLAPRKMRFGVSEGMVLCASGGKDGGGEGVFLLSAAAGVTPGMRIS